MRVKIDYCNAVFAEAPKTITDRLQRVLNAAARVVSDTRKFDRGLSRIMHTELHWLAVPERINYKLGMLMYRCQQQSSSVPDGPLHISIRRCLSSTATFRQ